MKRIKRYLEDLKKIKKGFTLVALFIFLFSFAIFGIKPQRRVARNKTGL